MRRLNSNVSEDGSVEKWKIPYVDIIAVGTVQFLLSLIILCYGVFLMQFILEDFYDLKTGLWTVIIFTAGSKITYPWTRSYCKHLDNIRHKAHKRNIIITVFLLSGELATVSFIHIPMGQILIYGISGGLLSTIIHVHFSFLTVEIFKNRPQLFNTLDQIMKPLCLILMPHLVLFLTKVCGTANSQLIISGLILNIIPACLLVRTEKYRKVPLRKFQTLERLSFEMSDLSPKPVVTEPSSSSDDDDDDDDADDKMEEETEPVPVEELSTSVQVQVYYQNVGVKMLPDIPEENEVEDEDDINEISSKRLSKISARLQELNENAHKNATLSVTNLYQPDESIEIEDVTEDNAMGSVGSDPEKNRCFSISSNAIYEMKVQRRRIRSFLREHFIRSFPRTLSKLYFYPAVISRSITTTVSAIILATAPYLMYEHENMYEQEKSRNRINPLTTEGATFLLTIIGFTWIFFLAGYPVFSKLSSFKVRILFLIGLSISGLSLFLAQRISYDNFTLFPLTFGLGHGIISYTENIACEDFFGKKWKKLQGALEISTGFIVILIYVVIYFSNLEMYDLLTYAYWPYVFNVSLWIVAYILKKIIIHVRNIQRYNRSRYPDYNF